MAGTGKLQRRSWLSQILLVVLLLRAMIPAGYMPDVGPASADSAGIVICSAHGSYTLGVNGAEQKSDPASQHKLTEPCAFSGLAQTYIPVIGQPEVLPVAISTPVHYAAASQAVLPPVRAGPALGSRAPPSIS